MNNMPASVDFAFVLPLQWPAAISARDAYERELVSYAKHMTHLLRASEGEQAELLLSFVFPIISDLWRLWDEDSIPREIRDLIRAVLDVENGAN
jgi:hypothetical protein